MSKKTTCNNRSVVAFLAGTCRCARGRLWSSDIVCEYTWLTESGGWAEPKWEWGWTDHHSWTNAFQKGMLNAALQASAGQTAAVTVCRWRGSANGAAPHDWVFFNPNQKHKQAQGFKTAFIKAREKVGILYLTSHGLRHYFCSHGMMSGVSKDVLRIQIGHASTQMLEQTYGHLSQEYQAQEMNKFSFFHPSNGSKPNETPKNIQSQEKPGSPAGAPQAKTGKGSGEVCLL